METLNVATSRESTLFTLVSFQSVQNTIETLKMGIPRESNLLPGILSKRVKHNRIVECGHSQRINFVTRHPPKACKTQQKQ